MNPKDILTKELLEIEYIDNKLSTKKIAEKYDIKSDNSVFQAIKRYGLSRDSLKNITNKITKDWLYQKYIIEDLSAIDIAKELGMKRKSSILDKLHEFNIPIRKTTKTKKYIVSNNKRKMLYKDIRIDYWNSLIFGAKRRKISFEISIEYAEQYQDYIKNSKKLETFIKNYVNDTFDLICDSLREDLIEQEEAEEAFLTLKHILTAGKIHIDEATKIKTKRPSRKRD